MININHIPLFVRLTKTSINTLLWANSHSSSFDVKIWRDDFVSKLYDSHLHIFTSSAVPALCPTQGDKQI